MSWYTLPSPFPAHPWLPPTPSTSTPLHLPPFCSNSKAYLCNLCNYVTPTLRLTADQYWTHSDPVPMPRATIYIDRKSTRLNSSHQITSYAVFCLTKKQSPILHPLH